jgi:hypothetical protein
MGKWYIGGVYNGPQIGRGKKRIDVYMITHVNKIAREERLHVWKAGPLSVFCGVSIKHFIKRKERKTDAGEDAPLLS